MNIATEVWREADKRGLGWVATGGGFDYVQRRVKTEHSDCEMTLSRHGASPKKLDEECEVGIAFHTSGYVSVGIAFPNVPAALDFMASAKGVNFLQSQYDCGKRETEGEYGGLRG